MANKRFDNAPKFVVKDDSVVIQQAVGSSAPLLDVKDHSGSSLMSITSAGAMTGASLTSPALTGTPTAPTATAGTNTTQVATTEFVRTEISNLVASAPAALDTLDELAAALGDDANFATTVTNNLATKAPLASPTFTGTVTLPATTSIGTVSATELGYIDGVTSAIQTQLNAKAPSASPTFTGTVNLPSDTTIGSVSSTELGYLDGVTSAIQTQLNAKAPTASPTFTGTLTASNLSVSGNVTSMLNFPTASTTNISAAGTLKGNGSVVQFAYLSHGPYDLTGGSWVASVPISPKYSNSYIYVWVNYHAYKYNTSGGVNNHYYLRNLSSGVDIRQNPYMMYGATDYMFQGVVSGVESAGSTGARTYALYVSASGSADRIYFYWLTMYALEIAN